MNYFNNVYGVLNSNIRSMWRTQIKLHVRDPILFPNLVNEYVSVFLTSTYVIAEYDTVLRQDKLVHRRQITDWQSFLF